MIGQRRAAKGSCPPHGTEADFNRRSPGRKSPKLYLDRQAVLHRLAAVDMTATEASRKAGLHPSYLSRVLRRDSPSLTPATREALTRVLGVDVTTPHDARQQTDQAPPAEKPKPPRALAPSQPKVSRATTVFVEPGPFIHPGPRVTVMKVAHGADDLARS